MPALVLPVPVLVATRWFHGELTDGEMFASSDFLNAKGDVVIYVAALFGKWSWREMRAQVSQFPYAVGVIARTKHPTVARVLLEFGGVKGAPDAPGEWRYWVGRCGLKRFLEHLRPKVEKPTL